MTLLKNRKLLSLLLALVMVTSVFPMSALAAETPDETHTCTDEHCTHDHAEEVADVYSIQADVEKEEPPVVGIDDETITEEPPTTEAIETPVPPIPQPEPTPDESVCSGDTPFTWRVESNGTLHISGNGCIEPFYSPEDQPWQDNREQIYAVRFDLDTEMEIYDLCYWFDGCVNLSDVSIPVYVAQICPEDFADCVALSRLTYGGVDVLSEIKADYDNQPVLELEPETEPDVGGISLFSASNCGITRCTCTGSCSWGYKNYQVAPESTAYHIMTVYCMTCGRTDGIIVTGNHSFRSNGYCSLCGYYDSAYDTTVCYHNSTYKSWSGCNWTEYCSNCGAYISSGTSHGSTYTEWSGCNWYDYCRDCGQLMNSGVSHSYRYGSWTYYNSSRHSRTGTCTSCGATTTSYGYHSTSTKYSPYSSTQHSYGSYCSACSSYVGSVSYANHSLSYSAWTTYSATQHKRTASCATCGYSNTEYASHSLTNGNWSSISSTQHQRPKTCSCGYSTTETVSHDLTYTPWTSHSATQHKRTASCATCGYSNTEYASHSLTNGAWSSISDTQHQRSKTCSCGYSTTETGAHTDANDDGYCDSCEYLMTRFSVTVPASLSLVVSKTGEVYSANNAAIVNNSTGAVEVTAVTVTTANGWSLSPYTANMANAKVDTKLIGFALNGAATVGDGVTEALTLSGDWEITKGNSLPLVYDAVVSAMSEPVSEQVLTIIFVLDWALQ